jgi:hypothetical protein
MNEPEAPDPVQADVAAHPRTRPPRTPAPGAERPSEIGGPSGPEPTRYGDWERRGRCIDF